MTILFWQFRRARPAVNKKTNSYKRVHRGAQRPGEGAVFPACRIIYLEQEQGNLTSSTKNVTNPEKGSDYRTFIIYFRLFFPFILSFELVFHKSKDYSIRKENCFPATDKLSQIRTANGLISESARKRKDRR